MWVCVQLRFADGTAGCLFFFTPLSTGKEDLTCKCVFVCVSVCLSIDVGVVYSVPRQNC